METGRVGFKRRDVSDLLSLHGVTDEQVRSSLLSLTPATTRHLLEQATREA